MTGGATGTGIYGFDAAGFGIMALNSKFQHNNAGAGVYTEARLDIVCNNAASAMPYASALEIAVYGSNGGALFLSKDGGVEERLGSVGGICRRAGLQGASGTYGTWWHSDSSVISGPGATFTIRSTGVNTNNWMIGATHFNGDQNAGIRVHRFGHSGWRATEFAAMLSATTNSASNTFDYQFWNNSSGMTPGLSYYATAQWARRKPALFILMFGINDYQNNVLASDYYASLMALVERINRFSPKASVLLVLPYAAGTQTDASKAVGTRYADYQAAMRAVVDAFPNSTTMLDLWEWWNRTVGPSPSVYTEYGWFNVHQNPNGYTIVADLIYRAITRQIV
jgi:hypothetical protein